MNKRNIERILDVLDYAKDHYNQTFMEDDIYKAYPSTTSNIIDLLIERDVLTSTKDGLSFDDCNLEEYRSLLSDLQDEIEELELTDEEGKPICSRLELHLNFNFNAASIEI